MSRCQFLLGDVYDRLAELPDHSVDLIVTSPPFLALRSYLPADHPDKHKEIGSEPTPAAFLSTLLALTREWRRVLAPHGSIAVELGDTYAGGGGWGDYPDAKNARRNEFDGVRGGHRQAAKAGGWPLAKSLCLIPSLYAGSLAYGHNLLDPDDTIEPWRIRNVIVWHRPNPPVGALGDKVRPSTSYITTACISDKRWFDLDAERTDHGENATPAGAPPLDCWIDGDVWTIPTAPYKGAHYATYPIALPRRLINLMCPREVCVVCGEPRRRITDKADEYGDVMRAAEGRDHVAAGSVDKMRNLNSARPTAANVTLGWTDCGCTCWLCEAAGGDHACPEHFRRGVVLDPFAGSGTTLIAAAEQGRDAIGIDLDPRNLDLARQRIGLFLDETPPTERATP